MHAYNLEYLHDGRVAWYSCRTEAPRFSDSVRSQYSVSLYELIIPSFIAPALGDLKFQGHPVHHHDYLLHVYGSCPPKKYFDP